MGNDSQDMKLTTAAVESMAVTALSVAAQRDVAAGVTSGAPEG